MARKFEFCGYLFNPRSSASQTLMWAELIALWGFVYEKGRLLKSACSDCKVNHPSKSWHTSRWIIRGPIDFVQSLITESWNPARSSKVLCKNVKPSSLLSFRFQTPNHFGVHNRDSKLLSTAGFLRRGLV